MTGTIHSRCALLFEMEVYELDQQVAVRGLYYELIAPALDAPAARAFVILATSAPTRLYHFIGSASFESLFQPYRGTRSASFHELPGSLDHIELHCIRAKQQTRAGSFALMTEEGIFHGNLLASTASDGVISESGLLPYPSQLPPLSVAMSEFHFLLLYHDRLQVISRLNGHIVQEDALEPARSGTARGLARDPAPQGDLWLYSDKLLHQVLVTNEDRDVWKLYLEKALAGDERKFNSALQHCRGETERCVVHHAQAQFYLEREQYHLAAEFFAKQTFSSFEEVALRFVELDEEDALKTYLLAKIDNMPPQDKTQRTMICTWIAEIFLHKLIYLVRLGNVMCPRLPRFACSFPRRPASVPKCGTSLYACTPCMFLVDDSREKRTV